LSTNNQDDIGYWFPLPEGWCEIPLGDLFEVQLGKMKGKNASIGEQYKYLKGRNLQWGNINTDSLEQMHFSPAECIQYQLLPGDLLVSEYGEVGRCAIWSGDVDNCFFQNHIFRIRATGNVPVIYLRYFLEYATMMPGFARFVTQTSVKQISQTNLKSIPIPFNPSDFDTVCDSMETADGLINTTTKLIKKIKQIREGFILSLIGCDHPTGEVDGFWTKLHDEWTEAPLGQIFYTQLGKMVDAKKNVGLPSGYISNRNVQWGRILSTDLDEMGFTESEREFYSLNGGDLVMCEGGEVGRCAVVESDCSIFFQKSIHRIRPLSNVGTRYLMYFFEFITKQPKFKQFVNVTSIAHLSQKNLRNIPVHFPISGTGEIEQTILRFDQRIYSQEDELKKLQNIRRGILIDTIQGEASL